MSADSLDELLADTVEEKKEIGDVEPQYIDEEMKESTEEHKQQPFPTNSNSATSPRHANDYWSSLVHYNGRVLSRERVLSYLSRSAYYSTNESTTTTINFYGRQLSEDIVQQLQQLTTAAE